MMVRCIQTSENWSSQKLHLNAGSVRSNWRIHTYHPNLSLWNVSKAAKCFTLLTLPGFRSWFFHAFIHKKFANIQNEMQWEWQCTSCNVQLIRWGFHPESKASVTELCAKLSIRIQEPLAERLSTTPGFKYSQLGHCIQDIGGRTQDSRGERTGSSQYTRTGSTNGNVHKPYLSRTEMDRALIWSTISGALHTRRKRKWLACLFPGFAIWVSTFCI